MLGKSNFKSRYRGFFLALQSDCKAFPGGISALASQLSINGKTLANQLNPDYPEAMPTIGTLLELVSLADARRPVFVLASMVGQTTMDFELECHSKKEAVRLFLGLMKRAGSVIGTGSDAISDLRFDSAETDQMETLLLDLMRACGELLLALRAEGGI